MFGLQSRQQQRRLLHSFEAAVDVDIRASWRAKARMTTGAGGRSSSSVWSDASTSTTLSQPGPSAAGLRRQLQPDESNQLPGFFAARGNPAPPPSCTSACARCEALFQVDQVCKCGTADCAAKMGCCEDGLLRARLLASDRCQMPLAAALLMLDGGPAQKQQQQQQQPSQASRQTCWRRDSSCPECLPVRCPAGVDDAADGELGNAGG